MKTKAYSVFLGVLAVFLVRFPAIAGNMEYFVTVNPKFGTFNILDSIPGVYWIGDFPTSCTALDKDSGRYFFLGRNLREDTSRLYSLDVHTGNILSSPIIFPAPTFELQFDDSTRLLYGIQWDTSTQTEYFMSISEITGAVTVINTLPGVQYIDDGVYTYNQKDHIYMFVGTDPAGHHIYSIKATDGSIISQPLIPANAFVNMRYDNSSNILYGHRRAQLITIDPGTGSITVVCNVPELQQFVYGPDYTTYDEINHHYITAATDSHNVFRLFSIDVIGDSVVYSAQFPVGITPGGNVIELDYDNNSGILYGLHWGIPPGISVNMNMTATCNGVCTGTASAVPLNGTPPYTYSWFPINSSDSSVSNLCTGTYSVVVTDSNGYTGTESVAINATTAVAATATALHQVICQGDSTQICATSGFASYAWNISGDGACIFATAPGSYVVTVTDENGCTGSSNTVNVSNYATEAVSITVNGDTITCYNAVSCQWSFNNHILTGDTGNSIIARQEGIYTVEITDSNGCSDYSSAIVFSTGIDGPVAGQKINVYPNPLCNSAWQVDVSENLIGSFYKIFDADSRTVYQGQIKNRHFEILAELAKGDYVMEVVSKTANYNIRLVKLN